MLPLHQRGTAALTLAVAFGALLTLSGCEGVGLEGKLFDWMGVSSAALETKTKDPRMEDRAPLVVPPKLSRLPEPGSGKTEDTSLAALQDPELKKAQSAKERERLHLAYCRGELQWKEKALDQNYSGNKSPYGACPSLFGVTDKVNQQ
jgi:hypothetical protein